MHVAIHDVYLSPPLCSYIVSTFTNSKRYPQSLSHLFTQVKSRHLSELLSGWLNKRILNIYHYIIFERVIYFQVKMPLLSSSPFGLHGWLWRSCFPFSFLSCHFPNLLKPNWIVSLPELCYSWMEFSNLCSIIWWLPTQREGASIQRKWEGQMSTV